MNNTIVVGCDIGGSHISTALVDLQQKTLLADSFSRQAVDSGEDVAAIISAWGDCIQSSLKKGNLSSLSVGMAIPGPFDYEQGISLMKNQDKYDRLYEVNVKVLLADYLAIAPERIRFINDAASFLEGEMFAGAGKIFHTGVGLTLGTGLGSALFYDGQAMDGDLWCAPFREGIAEDYLSGRWLKQAYMERSGKAVEHVKELAELASADSTALSVFEDFGQTLGEFILEYLLVGNPECLVIGGNIAKANALFLTKTHQVLIEKGLTLPIKTAELGEMAAVFGAASTLK